MEDIADFLAFEVKKELADRYFSFRKQIEEDSACYVNELNATAVAVENTIGGSLLRLYLLLQNEKLVRNFITLCQLPENYFYDPYFHQSATIRTLAFKEQHFRGFTKKSRFKNMFFDTYQQLSKDLDHFEQEVDKLHQEHGILVESIKLFYRNNDIDSIMDFLRRLDTKPSSSGGLMPVMANSNSATRLNEQLRLHPPRPVSDLLAPIPRIPPLKSLKKALSQTLNDIWKLYGPHKLRFFTGGE